MPRRRLAAFWRETRRLLLLVAGTLIAALAYAIFQVPYNKGSWLRQTLPIC